MGISTTCPVPPSPASCIEAQRLIRFSFSGFSLPRYRLRDSSGYSYEDLYFVPTASNAQIADTMPPVYDVADVQMYIVILFLGVVILCFMKRS